MRPLPIQPEGTAVLSAARIFRIFLGQIGEISARLQLFENVLRFLARLFHSLGVNFAIRAGQRSLDQNVAHADLLRHPVIVAVLIVIALQDLARDTLTSA